MHYIVSFNLGVSVCEFSVGNQQEIGSPSDQNVPWRSVEPPNTLTDRWIRVKTRTQLRR